MKRVLSSELSSHIGKQITLRGWLHNFRSLGKVNFLILRDFKGLSQIVVQEKELVKEIAKLQPGSILQITGIVVSSDQAPLGVEVTHPKIIVEVPIFDPPPIDYTKPEIASDLEFILDHRPIALRNGKLQAIFKIQAEITHAFRLYMHDKVLATEYFAPNIIGASSEGGAEFFNVDYFGYTATLAQSSQLYKQMMVGVNERVFALMPFFRAEPSQTPRHLAEGKQFEFEMGFFDHWHEIMDVQEGCLKSILKYLYTHCQNELALLGYSLVQAPEEVPFPRITFEEAQEIYFKRSGIDERSENDLSPAAERELCAYAKETFGTEFVFITDWLTTKRPFYSYPNEKSPHLTNTFDLLCGGTEITSGGQRRHTYASMVEGLISKGMNPNNFEDYLSIFKYGMPPHGGFGMGLERLTMTLLKLKNIRETSLFPSDTKRIAGNRIKAHIFFGGENIRNEIIRQLREKEIPFEHLLHEPAPTAEDSAKIRGTPQEMGIKALIVKGKTSKKNFQFNVPAHLKLDMKVVNDLTGEKCEFEDAGVIKERFGILVGGIPPFGNLLNLDTFFDSHIVQMEDVVFNCGLKHESIKMQGKDLILLVDPKMGSFAKP